MPNVHQAQLRDGTSRKVATDRHPMRASRGVWLLAGALTIGMATAAQAAGAVSPQEIAAQRQDILDRMLTRDAYEEVATQRWVCALGREPATVAESRAGGANFFPDAADSCVTALVRVARDGRLPDLYGELTGKLGGDAAASAALPRAIGASVTHDGSRVALGNGKAAVVTPALAFDAGFTVAYQAQTPNKEGANARQLKALAEACLAQQQEVGACFSAGYLYGARSFGLRSAAAR